MIVFGVLFAVAALIFALMVWCQWHSLKMAIDVVDAAADFLFKTKRIIAVPVMYFFMTVICVVTWLGAVMCINTMGEITADTSLVPQLRVTTKTEAQEKLFVYLFLFMFLGILWILQFIQAKTSFIAMVSATTYYFNSNKDHDGEAEVGFGFRLAYAVHAGSLAFGSLIIAIIQFIRIIVVSVMQQAQRAGGDNVAVRVTIAVANCCLKCVEKICDYINSNAYAYMAVSGESFCSSAWNGLLLNMKHGAKYAFAKFLAEMFIALGKVSIVVLNVFSCYMIMKHITMDLDEISSPIAPLVIVGVVTYISASTFLCLFDESVLALLTCLAIDLDLNGEPKFGPPTFHDGLAKFEAAPKKNAIQDGGWEKTNEVA
jgi:choline transporter-like protein 2/4/5